MCLKHAAAASSKSAIRQLRKLDDSLDRECRLFHLVPIRIRREVEVSALERAVDL